MRAAIFIDGGYIQSQLKQNKVEPDYKEMADHFLEPIRDSIPLDLLRCYYYYCPPYMSQEPTDDERKRMEAHEEFFQEIESLDRWSMRLGKLQKRWDGKKEVYEQKRVDVLLSVDMVRHAAAGHIQHAVLVAGDSDFIPAVEAAKEHGVTVSLWCGNYNTAHRDLIALADEVHVFDWSEFPRPDQAGDNRASNGQEQQGSGRKNSRRRRPRKSANKHFNVKNDEKSVPNSGHRHNDRRPARPQRSPNIERHEPAPVAVKSSWTAKIRRMAGWKSG